MEKELEKMVTLTEAEVEYLIDIMSEEMSKRYLYKKEKQKTIQSVFKKIAKLLN